MRLKLAARQSDLARIQAFIVGKQLRETNPGISVEYIFRESLGDKNQDVELWKIPEKGVFTEDFVQGLVGGTFDAVIHSWKDLPTEERSTTEVVATLPRADARDVLLVKKTSSKKPHLKILTSSPRRIYNLRPFLEVALPSPAPSIDFVAVRGNIPTRMRKLFEESADGLVLAKAALDRLLETEMSEFVPVRENLRNLVQECFWMVLPLSQNPTAPAQGALAIEISKEREDLRQLFSQINDVPTFYEAESEREILKSYGGGCHQKIGVSVTKKDYGEVLSLRGETDSGETLNFYGIKDSTKPRVRPENLWSAGSNDDWFEREPVSADLQAIDGKDLWVAKAVALPMDTRISEGMVVWTSGIETWRKLAARGIWVNGTADGLGEDELPKIGTLLGRPLKWIKVTHEGGGVRELFDSVSTYRLVPKKGLKMSFEGKTHFYWKSGSSFLFALKQQPWIRERHHACGPGNTREILRRELGGRSPEVFLSHEEWLRRMTN